MSIRLRLAMPDDLALVFPRTRSLNDHEGITIDSPRLEAALRQLLGNPGLGGVWLVLRDGEAIGYAIVTYGYDLEFGGREGWRTEFWIDSDQRSNGAGSAALALLDVELRLRDVKALHLQVRPDNPAFRLYERAGFVTSPRRILTRLIG